MERKTRAIAFFILSPLIVVTTAILSVLAAPVMWIVMIKESWKAVVTKEKCADCEENKLQVVKKDTE